MQPGEVILRARGRVRSAASVTFFMACLAALSSYHFVSTVVTAAVVPLSLLLLYIAWSLRISVSSDAIVHHRPFRRPRRALLAQVHTVETEGSMLSRAGQPRYVHLRGRGSETVMTIKASDSWKEDILWLTQVVAARSGPAESYRSPGKPGGWVGADRVVESTQRVDLLNMAAVVGGVIFLGLTGLAVAKELLPAVQTGSFQSQGHRRLPRRDHQVTYRDHCLVYEIHPGYARLTTMGTVVLRDETRFSDSTVMMHSVDDIYEVEVSENLEGTVATRRQDSGHSQLNFSAGIPLLEG
jgi:hypothetical protein